MEEGEKIMQPEKKRGREEAARGREWGDLLEIDSLEKTGRQRR
jgi:hypothetical protein